MHVHKLYYVCIIYIYVIKFIKIYMKHIPNSCLYILNFIMGNVLFVDFIDSSIASLEFKTCL